jgi:hypothetical protein
LKESTEEEINFRKKQLSKIFELVAQQDKHLDRKKCPNNNSINKDKDISKCPMAGFNFKNKSSDATAEDFAAVASMFGCPFAKSMNDSSSSNIKNNELKFKFHLLKEDGTYEEIIQNDDSLDDMFQTQVKLYGL